MGKKIDEGRCVTRKEFDDLKKQVEKLRNEIIFNQSHIRDWSHQIRILTAVVMSLVESS